MQQPEEVRACRACLATDCELHELKENGLAKKFQQVTAIPFRFRVSDNKPKQICSFCRALLLKAYRFRLKCKEINKMIGKIPMSDIRRGNKEQLLTITEMVVVSFKGENDGGNDIDPTASSDYDDAISMEDDIISLQFKEEKPEIDNIMKSLNVYGDAVNETVENIDKEVISEDDKSNIQLYSSHNASALAKEIAKVIFPTLVTQSDDDVKDKVFVKSPRSDIGDPSLVCNDKHDILNAEAAHDYMEVDYLEDNEEDVNDSELEDPLPKSNDMLDSLNEETNQDYTEVDYLENNEEDVNAIDSDIPEKIKIKSEIAQPRLSLLQNIKNIVSKKGRIDTTRLSFYRHLLDKYHYKTTEAPEKADIWDLKNEPADVEMEKQNEIANNRRNRAKQKRSIMLFYRFLDQKYSKYKRVKLVDRRRRDDLYTEPEVTPKGERELEKKYQMKTKCLKTKEEKIHAFQAKKFAATYLSGAYKCDVCYVGFTQKGTYTKHMLVHDPVSGPLECEICHRRYKTHDQLRNHLNTHRYQYTCLVAGCGHVTFKSAFALRHARDHRQSSNPCKDSGKVYPSIDLVRRHRLSERGGGGVPCPRPRCRRRLASAAALDIHCSLAHPQVFRFPGCDIEFATEAARRRHGPRGGAGAGAVRAARGETEPSKEDLQRHIETYHPWKKSFQVVPATKESIAGVVPPGSHRCEECGKAFPFRNRLFAHIETSHQSLAAKMGATVETYRCEDCGKTFLRKPALHLHVVNNHPSLASRMGLEKVVEYLGKESGKVVRKELTIDHDYCIPEWVTV